MSPEMAKTLAEPVDLEWLIGCETGTLNEPALRSKVTSILSWREFPDEFEAHFTMFNALTGVSYSKPSDKHLDEQLAKYILTCPCDAKSMADFIQCDLAIDSAISALTALLIN